MAPPIVVHSFAAPGGGGPEALAAQELQRLLGQLKSPFGVSLAPPPDGALPGSGVDALVDVALADSTRQHVFVAHSAHAVAASLARRNGSLAAALGALTRPDAHLLHSVGANAVLVTGKTGVATLYAAYALAEELGAGFYLHGEVLPPADPALRLPSALCRPFTPRFAVRGLQPFHDFPMGPDWWQRPFWKALSTNMVKMKFNFFGFHTYPTKNPNVEPLVWVGAPTTGGGPSYDTHGNVTEAAAYQASWYIQEDFFDSPAPASRDAPSPGAPKMRGNVPGQISRATSDYCCGASLVFERDCYGSEAQAEFCYPNSTADAARMMNNAQALIKDAFDWAESYAFVDGCVGVEFPLSLPAPAAKANVSLLDAYTGMFARIKASGVPISTFWLWTTETVEDHTTGKGYPQKNPLWAELVGEIRVAQQAMAAVGANWSLGTNGWTVGPGDNASYFDLEVPDPSFKIAAISGSLGWLPPDPAFGLMNGERAWVIPWMEDDMSLNNEELWVNRTLHHGNLAAGYKSAGLLGLMWRTWETAPQIKALAVSGWEETGGSTTDVQLFTQFCTDQFGAATAAECADLFLAVDGTAVGQARAVGKLPRDGQACCGGPMQAASVPASHLLNISGFEAWLPKVGASGGGGGGGKAYAERAQQWVDLFTYHRQTQIVANASAALDSALGTEIKADQAAALAIGVPLAKQITAAYERMVTLLLQYGTTPGTLGMLGAHEGANWPTSFGYADAATEYPYHNGAPITRLAAILSGGGPAPGPPRPPPTPVARCQPELAKGGCFTDPSKPGTERVLPHTVAIHEKGLTQELCAGQCAALNYSFAGVEYAVACFCGDRLPPASDKLPAAQCAAMKCDGNAAEDCGGADIILVYPFVCGSAPPAPPTPPLPPPPPPPQNYSRLIPSLLPRKGYKGMARMYQPAVRTLVSRAEAAAGVFLQAVVLSAAPPTAVTLSLCPAAFGGGGEVGHGNDGAADCTEHAMAVVADQQTGVAHSQVYGVRVVAPPIGFAYSMRAELGGGSMLRTPVEGNTTVTVLV